MKGDIVLTILEKNLVTRKARVQLKVVEIDEATDFTLILIPDSR